MAEKLVLHEDHVREYIGRLGGICQVLSSIPEFLEGANRERQTIRLTKEELGNFEPFETAWNEICDNRETEARHIAAFLYHNREKLIKAVEDVTGADMDSVALFPETEVPGSADHTSLETTVEGYGMDVVTPDEATVDRLGRNVPE